MPQRTFDESIAKPVMLLSRPLTEIRFANGQARAFAANTWTAAISALSREPIRREIFTRAFVGDNFEIQHEGLSPDVSAKDGDIDHIVRLQRRTIASFCGGDAGLGIGDVFVAKNASCSVIRAKVSASGWALRHFAAWVPANIQLGEMKSIGWVFVTESLDGELIACTSPLSNSLSEKITIPLIVKGYPEITLSGSISAIWEGISGHF